MSRLPVWPERPRLLVSYAYARGTGIGDLADRAELVIDSGAFTAMTTGVSIDVDEYTDWLLERAGQFRFAFALDVIGDPVASRENYERQAGRLDGSGVLLLPAWHIGTEFDELERLCGVAGYVAIGGAVRHYKNQDMLMRHLVKAHQIAERHNVRLHGLGVTGSRVVELLPWASVDSSSWTVPARHPLLYLADQAGRVASIKRGRGRLRLEHERLVRFYGGDPNVVCNPTATQAKFVGDEVAGQRRDWAIRNAVRSYMWVEAVKRLRCPDFRLYLAATPRDPVPIEAWRVGPPYPAAEAAVHHQEMM